MLITCLFNSILVVTLKWAIVIGLAGILNVVYCKGVPPEKDSTQSLRLKPEAFRQVLDQAAKRSQMPGGGLIVYENNKTIIKHTVGYRDFEEGLKFDSSKTRFVCPALSKLMVTLAVLQLAEAQKVQLDVDINKYISGFVIPMAFDRSISLNNLLSGLDGFETVKSGTCVRATIDVEPLRKYVAEHIPKRRYAPAEVMAFNDYAFALAAALVEEVSGENFNDYCRNHLFLPLGLRHTEFVVNKLYDKTTCETYYIDNQGFKKYPILWHQLYPARSLVTTLNDAERLTRMLLNPAVLDSLKIITKQTYHEHLFQYGRDLSNPKSLFFGKGFWKQIFPHIIGFSNVESSFGSTGGLLLFPLSNVGLFFYANGENNDVFEQVVQVLISQLTPTVNSPSKPPAGSEFRIQAFEGLYINTNYSEGEILGNWSAIHETKSIQPAADNPRHLNFIQYPNPITETFYEETEFVFLGLDGLNSLLLMEGRRANYVFYQGQTYESQAFYQSPAVINVMVVLVWFSFLGYLVLRLWQKLTQVHRFVRYSADRTNLKGLTDLLVFLVFVFSLGIVVVINTREPHEAYLTPSIYVKGLVFIPVIIKFLALLHLYFIQSAWRGLGISKRIGYVWLFICLLMVWRVCFVLQISYY